MAAEAARLAVAEKRDPRRMVEERLRDGLLRMAPHVHNTSEDIDRLLIALEH